MTQDWNSGWMQWTTLAQGTAPAPQAGATPQAGGTPAPAQAVGVPGSASTTNPGATGSQPVGPGTGGGTGGGSPLGGSMMFLVLAMVGIMLFTSIMAGRKDKKKRAELISSIKKQDKVQMMGGIIGTVVEMTDDEVVLRVEEGRIRFHKSAVQGVLQSRGKPGESSIAEVKGEPKTTSV